MSKVAFLALGATGSRMATNLPRAGVALGVLVVAALPLCGSTQSFNVSDDVALRIRLDDTVTSVDSEVGDPLPTAAEEVMSAAWRRKKATARIGV